MADGDRPTVVSALLTVVDTLDQLHRRGLIHGRLGPAHIVLTGRADDPAVLCSPGGDTTDPLVDWWAMVELGRQLLPGRFAWPDDREPAPRLLAEALRTAGRTRIVDRLIGVRGSAWSG